MSENRLGWYTEIKKWEGQVTAIDFERKIFWANLKDVKTPEVELQTSFDFDKVKENDRSLIAEGAIFYWSIGYKKMVNSNPIRVSLLLFRHHQWNIDQKKIDQKVDNLHKLFTEEENAK